MIKLTDAQVLAAAATDRLVNVISSPGSGKTTIATERYGYLRYQAGDLRGVAGLTFNRAAADELRHRVKLKWGDTCIKPPHCVITFDHLHVDLLSHLIREGKITWPDSIDTLDVRDNYNGSKGFRYLKAGDCRRVAQLDHNRIVISTGHKVKNPCTGIGCIKDHQEVLRAGIVSHEDVRSILRSAVRQEDLRELASKWLSERYRALVIDEVYDGDSLDLYVAYLAAEAGLSVTLVGDPWQALYKWRGAEPEVVKHLLSSTSDPFIGYEQPESFRFFGDQMPKLASNLRAGASVILPHTTSNEIDVALARTWGDLWSVGDNVLPLAFRTVNNATDAALNLLLDVVTRARLGTASYGRETAIARLGLERERFLAVQDDIFNPLIESLRVGEDEAQVLEDLRESFKRLGVRKPRRLKPRKERIAHHELARLAARLRQPKVIPGLTVFQAKGREWERVGVALSGTQLAALESGLHELEEENCITYVAITRAKRFCGLLTSATSLETDHFRLEV